MTEVQTIELELLKEFLSIAERLNITYYLVCGSALGAIKYNGFIPWDDDIDIGIPRPDYERFLCEAPHYLPNHVFLQNFKTDRNFPSIISKLRNSNTTWIEAGVQHINMHHGVGIDIFPLDGYPTQKHKQYVFEIKRMQFERIRSLYFYHERINVSTGFRTAVMQFLHDRLGVYPKASKEMEKFTIFLQQNCVFYSALWCNFGNWQGKLEYAPCWHYGKGTWATFEGLRVRVPEQYDAYLTQKYGNWKADLPDKDKKSGHFFRLKDCSKPYTDYLKILPDGTACIIDE